MLVVRCKNCNSELVSHPTKTKCCGCSNKMTIVSDKITALDLSKVVIVSNIKTENSKSVFSPDDLQYQEDRRKRKVRRLEFEVK